MSQIEIVFIGICTQLIARDKKKGHPQFTITDTKGGNVLHRVFVANPLMHCELVDRCVPPHTPKWRINGEQWQNLPPVVLRIDGTVHEKLCYEKGFASWVPSVWELTGPKWRKPQPGKEALDPWSPRAQLFFDFYEGATFDADRGGNVQVTVHLRHGAQAELVSIDPTRGSTHTTKLDAGTVIEIRNIPDLEFACTDEDYLLHYVVTDYDLGHLPRWPRPDLEPPELRKKKKIAYDGMGNHEVYCSNSTYP